MDFCKLYLIHLLAYAVSCKLYMEMANNLNNICVNELGIYTHGYIQKCLWESDVENCIHINPQIFVSLSSDK